MAFGEMGRRMSFCLMEYLFILCFISHFLFSCALSKAPTFEAIYQFGDSIADTGNDIHEIRRGAHYGCGRPPYGHTFFHHASGRCSDGRLMIDFIGNVF